MTFDIDLPDLRVRPSSRVRLKSIDTDSTGPYESKEVAEKHLRKGVQELRRMQEMLYAQDQQALLLVFQAMDGAGKDRRGGPARHVRAYQQYCDVRETDAIEP